MLGEMWSPLTAAAAVVGSVSLALFAQRKVASLVPKDCGDATLFYDGVCNL